MKKIKIAIDTTMMDGRTAKGTAIVIRKHIEGLYSYKNELDITLVHKFAQPTDKLYQQFNEIVIPRVWNYAFGGVINELLFFVAYWIQIMLGKKEKFDIYFVAYSRILPTFLLVPAKKFIFHAMDGGAQTSGFMEKTKTPLMWYVLLFKHRIDKFIALTRFGQKGIMEVAGLPEEKVPIVLNGVEDWYGPTSEKEKTSEYLAETYGFPRKYILDVSRWDPHKNILNLLDAYAIYMQKQIDNGEPILPLVFVGGRHMPEYSARVDKKIQDLKIEKYVIVAPFIQTEDMPKIYQAAECLLFPSFYEGFGLPVIEAFACGCPVLVSNIEALLEVGGDATCIVDPYDISNIAEGIIRILEDSEFRQSLVLNGYVQVKKFTWKKSSESMVQVFRDVIR